MMKKNTILKILSFVLVLTMVVAAVLLTGCGNKKEDPKASQAELDAAKAALAAAQAEIEKIQANLDKMSKDGSATADDLKKAQEELEAAKKALEELTTASTSEEVYNALYGEDSEKTLAKYAAKVVELADAKRNIEYIVGYGDTIKLKDSRADWDKVGGDYTKGENYATFAATPVGAVEVKCLAWMASRLALATSTKVVDQVWADMEAEFAGIKKIVDKYDDELASLLPDAEGGKLTLIKEDKDGNLINQLATLNAYHQWILDNDELEFNGATKEVAEPKAAEYKAINEAYGKLYLVYAANKYAATNFVTNYGTKDTSAIQYEHKTVDGKIVETDKVANEKVGKFFTDFVLYYEVTVKEEVDGKPVDKVYLYSTHQYGKFGTDAEPEYSNGGNTLNILKTDGKPNGKYKVGDKDVTAKAFKFADVFSVDANADAKYYVAVNVEKDLSANATYFARKARYEQLDAAKAEFATLFTQLTSLKSLSGQVPYMTGVAKVETDLNALNAWMAKYDLVDGDPIDTKNLTGDALAAATAANDETEALNVVKNAVRYEIFKLVDKVVKTVDTTDYYAFGKTSIKDDYLFLASVIRTVAELKQIQAELVTPEVKGTNKSLSALFESWKTNTVDAVKYADYETYKDAIDRIEGYVTKKDGKEVPVLGIKDRLNPLYDTDAKRTAAYEAMIGQEGTNATTIDDLLKRAKLLNTVNGEVEALAINFRDTYTEVAKATDDLTGKETTTKKNDKDETITLYWDIDFDESDQIANFAKAVDARFSEGTRDLLPAADETTGVRKENYDLITETAKKFLAQATAAFATKKAEFVAAYEQVKSVIYTVRANETTKKNELGKVFDNGTVDTYTDDKVYLSDLANILWAKGIIEKLDKGAAKFTDADGAGKFVIDSFKLNEDDAAATEIKYATFRNDLNKAVELAVQTASMANSAANTKIVKVLAETKDTTATGKTLAEYTGLNQNKAVDDVVADFRAWCVTYLGAEQTYKKDKLDDEGKPTGEKEDVKYTDAEFFANVEKYFVDATADGKATGILGIKNGNTTYTFVSKDTFATIKTIDAAKDAKTEAARVAFLEILNNKTLLPVYATVEDIDSVCEDFVNYVKTYYMPDGESLEAVNAYYEVVDATAFKTTAGKNKVQDKLKAETKVEKAARYATYIATGIDFVIDPKAEKPEYVGATEKALHTDLAAFITAFKAVEDAETDEARTTALKAFFAAYDYKFVTVSDATYLAEDYPSAT